MSQSNRDDTDQERDPWRTDSSTSTKGMEDNAVEVEN